MKKNVAALLTYPKVVFRLQPPPPIPPKKQQQPNKHNNNNNKTTTNVDSCFVTDIVS